ncbi:protein of unknown function [Pseudooceanicola antarcticus]|uniref:DUF4287 domain-containing protein n=1 Tax=Pseudooceanicola antarcticus TaxID=1247613 RepID=A0A285J3K1_9RHOB|nr:DUF4287 domain-containing protein [Pseudooceanicola antarcticus]PJE29682.1 DUF4287 domain-containing protein [Pseudooceanicola antarcticus]SNY54854.1 protein of unknown function [Pseudooceanicola antarcticus]
MSDKVKGPASYFPSIEAKYGQPIEHWKEIIRQHRDKKHMEIVAVLKPVHGLGHGHANALVAHELAAWKAEG